MKAWHYYLVFEKRGSHAVTAPYNLRPLEQARFHIHLLKPPLGILWPLGAVRQVASSGAHHHLLPCDEPLLHSFTDGTPNCYLTPCVTVVQ